MIKSSSIQKNRQWDSADYSPISWRPMDIDGLTLSIQIWIGNHWLFQWFGKNLTQRSSEMDIGRKLHRISSLGSWTPDFYFGYIRDTYLVCWLLEFQVLILLLNNRILEAKSSNWRQFHCQFEFWELISQKGESWTDSTSSPDLLWNSPALYGFSASGVVDCYTFHALGVP